MLSRLSDCLLREGTLPPNVVRAASARQTVYGGALDTALLELDALDEPSLWAALAAATGVPIPEAALFENPDPTAAAQLDVQWSRQCRGVPVGHREGTLQILCGDPIDEAGLDAARAELSIPFEVYVVPEVRLAAARLAVYGEPMPARLVRLLARLLGAQPVRRWIEAVRGSRVSREGQPEAAVPLSPPGSVVTAPSFPDPPAPAPGQEEEGDERAPTPAPVEFDISVPSQASGPTASGAAAAAGASDDQVALDAFMAAEALAAGQSPSEDFERLCRAAEDPSTEARLPALRVLRARLEHPLVQALLGKLRGALEGPPVAAARAAEALAELRDAKAPPRLIALLHQPVQVADAAHRALVEIAKQDFGRSRRRWTAWWDSHGGEDRSEWLFDGLRHKAPEIRFAASEELRVLTGEYFGYHFDLPKRERDEARERWQAWWDEKRAALAREERKG
jgi:Type II secretion system (T2SS), protein E, N-terminal domain